MASPCCWSTRATVGADKGYDTEAFGGGLERLGIRAHVARKSTGSAVDGRTVRGKGYAMNLRRRKMIEEAFGWIKTVLDVASEGNGPFCVCRRP